MIVPNYVPDPLEIANNVTEQPWLVRVRYIRSTTLLHLASVVVVAGLVALPLPAVGWIIPFVSLLCILLVLELWRIAVRGKPIEAIVSASCLPLVLLATAWTLREVRDLGWPIWHGVVAPLCITLYAVLARKDYSFIGNLLLSLIFSSVAIAAIANTLHLTQAQSLFALGTNALLLTYLVYDLASLLSRRRLGEELAAVTDLYRDVLNFFGYFVRVVKHWHQYRILDIPTQIDLPWKAK